MDSTSLSGYLRQHHATARLVAGNVALLLPPLAPLYVVATRWPSWRGRQAVFWGAIGAWAALWFVGQIGWSADELHQLGAGLNRLNDGLDRALGGLPVPA